MRLHRIRVEHVRGLPAAEVHFAVAGVTVVEAPNESGKTSLFDAFDLLLREKHGAAKQVIKDLQPAGRDVGSVVEAELTIDGTHLTIRKCFNKDRSTELAVHGPVPRQLAGNEAHDELRRILAAGTDLALFEALRFEQGRALESIALGGSEQLARQLDASAGGSGATGDDALYERIVVAFERYFTPGGQDGRDLRDAAAAVVEAEDQVAALAQTARELEGAAHRSAELQAERVRVQDRLIASGPELERHRAQVRRLTTLRASLAAASSRCEVARVRRDGAVAAVTAREERVAAIAETEDRLAEREERVADATAAWERQQVRLDAIATVLVDAEREEAHARAAVRAARAAAELGRRRAELQALLARQQRIEAALDAASAADTFLADRPLTPAQLQAVRDAADELRIEEARLGDAAPTVRVTAFRALDVVVDGEPEAVAEDGVVERQVPDRLVVTIPGTVGFEIRAGASLADRQADRDRARRSLLAACAAIGVEDLAGAEELARTRGEHARTLAQRDASIARELDGRTREELDDAVRRLTTKVADLEGQLPADDPKPGSDTDQPEGGIADRLVALEASEEAARETAATARAEHQALGGEIARLRDAATRAVADAEHDQQELVAARARIDAERAAIADAQLQAAAATAEQELRSTLEQVAALEAEVAGLDPDEVELLADNAERSRDGLQAALADIRDQQARVSALIEVRGGQGVGEALQAAEAERDRRREAERSLRVRAAAARALKEAFETARDAAYAAYREPLRQRIVRAGRLVFGEDLDVELDEELTVVRRTLGGVTLGFERLSAGAREQLAILTALAAADLAGEDGVPLVLDDTLGYTDPGRLERLGAVLGRVRGPQVVILTCVGARFDAVGGARVVRLREVTTGP